MLQIGHYSFIMMDATAVANKNGAILASQIGCIPRRITVFFSHDQKLIQLDHFILEFPCRDLRITFAKERFAVPCSILYRFDLNLHVQSAIVLFIDWIDKSAIFFAIC